MRTRLRLRSILIFIIGLLEIGNMAFLGGCKKDSPVGPPPSVDSTSHATLWRTDTLGYTGNSVVMGVAIIAEDNIWAVGEFYFKDSTGQIDQQMYNVLRWDGLKWTPQRLTWHDQGVDWLRANYAIFAFDANDLWISSDGVPLHWDGVKLNLIPLGGFGTGGRVFSMWGTSTNDLYLAGSPGIFGHFDGSHFQPITTGIRSHLWAVTGQGSTVYIGSYAYDNQILPSGIFQYASGRLNYLVPDPKDSTNYLALTNTLALWLSPQGTLWATGEQFVFRPLVSHQATSGINPGRYLLHALGGTADSDVWVAGGFGTVLHWNGNSWYTYQAGELGIAGFQADYLTLAVKGNTVVLGGWTSSPDHAILTLGRRVR